MMLTQEQRETHKYTIHNADKSPRQLVIEHPVRENWKLVEGGVKPEETTASLQRFRVSVSPAATEHLTVEEHHPDVQQFELDDLDDKKVSLWMESDSLTPAARQTFQQAIGKVMEQKNQVASLEGQASSRQKEADSISKDQARLRENMKALKGSAEEKALLQRYTRQLDQQEDRLSTLQKEISDLEAKKGKADEDLTQMIQAIVLDENF
jgi:chromosome segregation ATPase